MVRKAKPKGRANTVKVICQDGKVYPIRSKKTVDVDKVIWYLQNTLKAQSEIGELCGCSRRTVNGINRGKMYYREELSYPIRK